MFESDLQKEITSNPSFFLGKRNKKRSKMDAIKTGGKPRRTTFLFQYIL
jgi:hypothetical protein